MIHKLQIRSFRCFDEATLDLGGRDVVLVGQNAQGKTSLLESICVLLRLGSPRSSLASELVQFGGDHYLLEGEWCDRRLRHAYQITQRGGVRKVAVDGEVQKRTGDYLAHSGRVVWMGNEDLELVRGRGETRRKYLDFLASQLSPVYRPALKAYEKALRLRNQLLKADHLDWAQIDAYTQLLIEHGEVLIGERTRLIALLQPEVESAQVSLSGAVGEVATMRYAPRAEYGQLGSVLHAAKHADARRGITTTGPHRDDVTLEINGRAASKFGSEGQQRSLVLSMKLAQLRVLLNQGGESPALLIDDVFGELDVARRNALLDALPSGVQKLVTTTHLDWLRDGGLPEAERLHVETGQVRKTE